MESNYRVAYYKEWSKLKEKNLLEVASRLGVIYNEEKNQFIVEFLNIEYILDCSTEVIYRKSDNYIPSISASIIMLNYLTFSKEPVQMSNNWVSLKEIPNGGILFYPAFYKSTIIEIIKEFGYNSESLEQRSKILNGKELEFGDKSIVFKVLPKISICVVVWEGDEEISPNATMLFDFSIQYLLHIETIIGLGDYLGRKLLNLT